MKTFLRLATLLGFLSLGLLASCHSSSGETTTSPDAPSTNSPVVGTWSLKTTGVLQILSFRDDGTFSKTYYDSTSRRWSRQTGQWTATDTSITTTVLVSYAGTDTFHLVGAPNQLEPELRIFSLSGSILTLTTSSGGVRVSLKYVAGTSGVLPAASSVAAPSFSVPSGTYSSEQAVFLSTTTAGATILYSLDGSNPLTPYSGLIPVSSSETIRAIAVLDGAMSAISSATYTISGGGIGDTSHNTQVTSVASPTFNPGSTTFSSTMMVALASTTDGATIYYTLTGLTPTTYSTVYTAPFLLITNTTVKAIAVKNGVSSEISTATYQIGSTSNHDASLIGSWLDLYYEAPDQSGTAYYDTSIISFDAGGAVKSYNHSLVVLSTGSSYTEAPDSLAGTWSTSGSKLTLAFPGYPEAGRTGTYSVSGSKFTLVGSDGTTTTMKKR